MNPDEEEFTAMLNGLSYDEILELETYNSFDRPRKAAALCHCAQIIEDFMERCRNASSLTEFKEHVRELPLYQQRMKELNIMIDQFKKEYPR